MKIRSSEEHNRTLIVSDLPETVNGYSSPIKELKITINYVDIKDGNRVERAVILDNVVIPEILRCVNAYAFVHDVLDKEFPRERE